AFASLPYRLLVVGEGRLQRRLEAAAPPNISFLGNVEQSRLLELYRTARALVYPANEDSGIVMAEAQPCGTPVVRVGAGGARAIVEDETSGWLVREQTVEAFSAA